jgi:HAD superfamily hydrolase (TIGR01459 family)
MTHHGDIAIIESLDAIAGNYDLIICDLWGVMHDGIKLHADAARAIRRAREAGAATIFLSNAPRPRFYVREHLIDMGLDPELSDFIVTSGGLARDDVRDNFSGAKLYHMGPGSDRNTIDGLPVNEVKTLSEAGVIVATGLDYPSPDLHRAYLEEAATRRIPLLCANPDRVVHVGNQLFYCAGSVADLYAEMGGVVHWFGKPMVSAFEACIKEVGLAKGAKALMIGDSLKTDIAGANAANMDSLLIASGLHREELLPNIGRQSLSHAAFNEMFSGNNNGNQMPVPTAILSDLK